jgi:hypothetical protein
MKTDLCVGSKFCNSVLMHKFWSLKTPQFILKMTLLEKLTLQYIICPPKIIEKTKTNFSYNCKDIFQEYLYYLCEYLREFEVQTTNKNTLRVAL